MWDRLVQTLASADWNRWLEQVSNERLTALFTQPLGLAALGVLLLLSAVLKWRILFVVLSGALAVSLLARYTLGGVPAGPDRTLFAFAAGGVAVGAFVIYFLFIRED